MKENKYDNKEFFNKYSKMDRSVKGLSAAGEWETLKEMLPSFTDKRVLDLGCGFGWHCEYAIEQGASYVEGIDISDNMLEVAREKTNTSIVYKKVAMEDIDYPNASFDIVISSLALHYIKDLDLVFKKVYDVLETKGHFVLSIEHPIFTAHGSQDWIYDDNGEILHFPVDNYFYEGKRVANFLNEDVVKYHRTMTSILNTLLQIGFHIKEIREPMPAKHLLDIPGMKDELRRPMMLLISVQK